VDVEEHPCTQSATEAEQDRSHGSQQHGGLPVGQLPCDAGTQRPAATAQLLLTVSAPPYSLLLLAGCSKLPCSWPASSLQVQDQLNPSPFWGLSPVPPVHNSRTLNRWQQQPLQRQRLQQLLRLLQTRRSRSCCACSRHALAPLPAAHIRCLPSRCCCCCRCQPASDSHSP